MKLHDQEAKPTTTVPHGVPEEMRHQGPISVFNCIENVVLIGKYQF